MDITSSVDISFKGAQGDPYVKDIPALNVNELMRSIMGQGQYAGGVPTISSGVVTIPAGAVFFVTAGRQLARVEFNSAVTITADATNDSVYMTVTEGVTLTAELNVAASYPSTEHLKIGVTSGGPPPSAIALDTNLQKIGPNKVIVDLFIPNVVTEKSYFVVAPCGGTITKISAVHDTAPDADIVLTAKIATVAVTNGVVTIDNADAAGLVHTASPTAANAIAQGAAIEIDMNSANTNAGTCQVQIEITQ